MSDIIENNNEELEENENYITLTDDDGNEVSFEILDTVEYKERVFAVLLPFDEEDDGPFCSDCGARISDKVKAFSVKKYGRALCMDCQKNEG